MIVQEKLFAIIIAHTAHRSRNIKKFHWQICIAAATDDGSWIDLDDAQNSCWFESESPVDFDGEIKNGIFLIIVCRHYRNFSGKCDQMLPALIILFFHLDKVNCRRHSRCLSWLMIDRRQFHSFNFGILTVKEWTTNFRYCTKKTKNHTIA